MGWLWKAVLWVYDFLAEDVTLLIGTVIALVVALLVSRANPQAAGYILFVVVVAVIAVSIWRTVSSSAT